MKVNFFWFRRDLRLDDNAALYHSLKSNNPVIPIFIFDTEILDKLDEKKDRRVEFIYNSLAGIQSVLNRIGSSLLVRLGKPAEIWKRLVREFEIESVFTNSDYEPYAIMRDKVISEFLRSKGISFNTYKDQVIFEKNEVVKNDGKPYKVYTSYYNEWRAKFDNSLIKPYAGGKYFSNFHKSIKYKLPPLKDTGFIESGLSFPSMKLRKDIIQKYDSQRDFPAADGTSKLSVHLRFGTISIRKLIREAFRLNQTWLKELIWREFYMMILYHFPSVVTQSFKPEYDLIRWRNNEKEFEQWCNGETGYPIVDAGMRELNITGYMHNRVRMITASFLTKHLLIDWRWGEAYFAKKLLDYELSSNNGGWQWAAGTGCDAAPYFRVFNPNIQTEKFDPELKYIKKWVPEYSDSKYSKQIVEHIFARKRAISIYKDALDKAKMKR